MDRQDDIGAEAAAAEAQTALPPTVPDALAERFDVVGADGAAVACYAWREVPADVPALLWGHANGFNAGCYAPVLRRLSSRFQVFAFDARGEGASEIPAGEPSETFTMDRLAADLSRIVAAVRARIGPDRPLHYASHSMCGNAAILLESRLREVSFRSMTLFEPPIHAPSWHASYARSTKSTGVLARWSAQRRERFPDRDALRREAAAIATFAHFKAEMLDAYVDAAAYETATGEQALFCPGWVESTYYAHAPASQMFAAASGVATPALIFSADPDAVDPAHVWAPAVIKDAVATMANGRYDIMPGCGHLMVQEDPDACVAAVIAHTGAHA